MGDILQKEVSFFSRIDDKRPKAVNLYDLLLSNAWREKVLQARMALANKGEKNYKEIKSGLPAYTISGLFAESKDDSLIKHSGLVCIDIDKKDNPDLENLDDLKSLIAVVPHVAYCGYSVSAQGFFCIIPISNPEKHEAHFRALEKDFLRCNIMIDKTCKNVGRKRFVSYDPEPYINLDAETYTRVYEDMGDRYCRYPSKERKLNATVFDTDKTQKKVLDVIETSELWRIDMTGDYKQWTNIGFALVNTFGEEGREMFHRISAVATSYDYRECDKKYTDLIRGSKGSVKIGTFFEMAKQAGVMVAMEFNDIMR